MTTLDNAMLNVLLSPYFEKECAKYKSPFNFVIDCNYVISIEEGRETISPLVFPDRLEGRLRALRDRSDFGTFPVFVRVDTDHKTISCEYNESTRFHMHYAAITAFRAAALSDNMLDYMFNADRAGPAVTWPQDQMPSVWHEYIINTECGRQVKKLAMDHFNSEITATVGCGDVDVEILIKYTGRWDTVVEGRVVKNSLGDAVKETSKNAVIKSMIDLVCTYGFDACITSSEKPKLTRYQHDIVFRMSNGKPVAIFVDYDGTRKPISSLSTEVMAQILITTGIYFEFMGSPSGSPVLVYDPVGQTLTAIIDRARSVSDYSGAIRLDASDYLSVIREAQRPELIKWAVDTEAYGYSWVAGNGRSSYKMFEAMSMLKGVTKIVTNSDRRTIIVTVNNTPIEFCYSNSKPGDPATVWYDRVQEVENQPQKEEKVIVSTEKEAGEGQEIQCATEALPDGVFGTEPYLMVCNNEHSAVKVPPYVVKGARLGSEAHVDILFRDHDDPITIASNPMIGRDAMLKAAIVRHVSWLDRTFNQVFAQVPIGCRITITPSGGDSIIKTEFRHMEVLTSN